ncbi:type IV secretion system protein [Psychrobacter submarinus]|uniref:type IV secretion system protein n=1 Tax=Psychrobacter submarinus TaxID=154108 RepID=UPI0019184957|nr:type IV secretion system protein [Psychrobacter submarinus]
MKNKLLTAVLSASMVLPLTALPTIQAQAAGVPVFDASGFARQMLELQEAYKQVAQAQAQFEQFRGTRDVGALFNQYGKYLPSEMQGMYRDYQTGNWQGLAEKIDRLQNSQRLTGTQKQQMQQLLEQEKRASLENKVKLDDMYARSVDRFNQIQRMANSVDLQNDPKAAADLLNRIQVESAMLSLQNNQLQMAKMLRESEKDLQAQKRKDRSRRFNETSSDKNVQQW